MSVWVTRCCQGCRAGPRSGMMAGYVTVLMQALLGDSAVNDTTTLPAPDLAIPHGGSGAWEAERDAFCRLLPTLLGSHPGRYVAVHGGSIVAEGADQIEVARQAYERVGYVPVYVGKVSAEPERPVRLPSPRLLSPPGTV